MKDYKIITLGGAGAHICRALLSQGIDANRISYFHTDRQIVEYLEIKDKFFVGEEVGICHYKMTKDLFDEHSDLFERTIEPDVLYVLACGLGGQTGTELVVNLSKLLVKKNRKFVIVATVPYRAEREPKMDVALCAFSELALLPDKNFILLPVDDMITPDLSISELFDRVNQHVVVVIKGILMKYEAC